MPSKAGYQNRIELLQGTLDLLILQTLQWGAQHGYGISNAIRANSGELLQVETGSLYPALHRLEKQGYLKSEWNITEANQRAKFYQLTVAGKKQLLAERDRWAQMVGAIAGVLKPVGPVRAE
jgi:PadR family transcriptional regulator PadR